MMLRFPETSSTCRSLQPKFFNAKIAPAGVLVIVKSSSRYNSTRLFARVITAANSSSRSAHSHKTLRLVSSSRARPVIVGGLLLFSILEKYRPTIFCACAAVCFLGRPVGFFFLAFLAAAFFLGNCDLLHESLLGHKKSLPEASSREFS